MTLATVHAEPSTAALTDEAFACLMARFAPFETRPRLAVGLSGGADSTALLHLAARWAWERQGEVIPLIVDHGLRPESAEEAGIVASRARDLGLAPYLLVRRGVPPDRAIEEEARRARLDLLAGACRDLGVLHLLLAHHRDDQNETVAMRRERASGALGLAGMSACIEHADLRLLRPLLPVSGAALEAYLVERDLPWIDDPMNHDPRFTRARLRRAGVPEAEGEMGRRRERVERRLAQVLPGIVTLDRYGVATLDRAAWRDLPDDLGFHALATIGRCVGGSEHAPRSARIEALVHRLRAGAPVSATLGRCLWRGDDRVSVMRELRDLRSLAVGGPRRGMMWDGRHRIDLPSGDWTVRALEDADRPLLDALDGGRPSWRVCRTLPAICGVEGVAAIPHLGWVAAGDPARFGAVFAPHRMLVPPRFVPGQESGIEAYLAR